MLKQRINAAGGTSLDKQYIVKPSLQQHCYIFDETLITNWKGSLERDITVLNAPLKLFAGEALRSYYLLRVKEILFIPSQLFFFLDWFDSTEIIERTASEVFDYLALNFFFSYF